MSLSGLDSSEVDAAAKSISQERGGWFLLQYVSRDTVQVLSQGTKGINEMRDVAVSYYKDGDAGSGRGPLFGMIDFRRRKVLVKLVSDDTSRLIKARVQVHWTSVTSRFPSHDSVFELTSPDQLTESRLLTHIELHSGRSSSGSNKKQTLDGISEEGGEDKVSPLQSSKSSFVANSVEGSVQQVSPLSSTDNTDHTKRISSLVGSAAATSAALQRSLTSPPDLTPVPEGSITTSTGQSTDWKDPNRSGSDAQSIASLSERRLSTQSGRPSTANDYSTSLYDYESLYKPKTKLGPRPATASRPVLKGGASAALPTGLRATRPGSLRPTSRDSTYSAFKIPPPPPIPESSSLDFMPRPRSSGNSVKSLPATLPKSPGMSREKQRLMRFREMYKEKENKRASKDLVALQKSSSTEPAPTNAPTLASTRSNDLPELTTTASDPSEGGTTRLSVISESSTIVPHSVTLASAIVPHSMPAEPALLPSESQTAATPTPDASKDPSNSIQNETFKAPTNIEKPRPSAESLATIPASSPVSILNFSEKTSSTRATSISDSSEHQEPIQSGALLDKDVTTPIHNQAEGEEKESQSSTPTAAPLKDKRDLTSKRDSREKRRMVVSPIAIPTESTESETDGEGSYDDDLMAELDDAEVQEAYSMSVSKSPITPFFSRRPSGFTTPGSPGSAVMPGKTPSPMPSPMPSNAIENVQSWSPASKYEANVPRRPSDTLSKQIEVGEQEDKEGVGLGPDEPTELQRIYRASLHSAQQLESSHAEPRSANKIGEQSQSGSEEAEAVVDEQTATEQFSATISPPEIKESLISDRDMSDSINSRNSSTTRRVDSLDETPTQTPPALSRSSSGTLLSAVPQHQENNVAVQKRRNLGSGVAAKIADLQRNFSGKTSSNTLPTSQGGSRKSSVVSVRANSIRDNTTRDPTPPHSGSAHALDDRFVRGRALSKASLRSFDSRDTRTSTPPRQKSSSSIGKLDSKRFTTFNNSAIEVTSKVETIQVKATIIRTDLDSQTPAQEMKGLGLQNSPLDVTPKISHVEPHPSYSQPRTSVIVEEPRSPTKTSIDKAQKRHRARSSISSALGLTGRKNSSPVPPPESSTSPVLSDHGRQGSRASVDMGNSWRSLRRRTSASLSRSPSVTRELSLPRSPSAQGHTAPFVATPNPSVHPGLNRNMSSSSLESAITAVTVDPDVDASHKRKGSRATRMLKRMSNSMTSILGVSSLGVDSGQGSAVETVEEEKWVGADLGEVNVQFPDTLLWKRRYLEIDTQGYLVLKPHENSKSGVKNASIRSTMTYDKKMERKYHLGQFFPPFAPDMERMEMPYSVVLDFREDGGTLQVAADSSLGQNTVLRVLSEAHRVCSY